MAAILQTTLWNSFSCMKIIVFLLKFHLFFPNSISNKPALFQIMACYQTVSQTVMALFTNAHMHHSLGLDESTFLVFRLKYSRSILNLYCGCWCPGSVMVLTMSLSPLRKNHSTYVTSVWIVCLKNSTSSLLLIGCAIVIFHDPDIHIGIDDVK